MNWVNRSRTSADERDVVWAPHCRDCGEVKIAFIIAQKEIM